MLSLSVPETQPTVRPAQVPQQAANSNKQGALSAGSTKTLQGKQVGESALPPLCPAHAASLPVCSASKPALAGKGVVKSSIQGAPAPDHTVACVRQLLQRMEGADLAEPRNCSDSGGMQAQPAKLRHDFISHQQRDGGNSSEYRQSRAIAARQRLSQSPTKGGQIRRSQQGQHIDAG